MALIFWVMIVLTFMWFVVLGSNSITQDRKACEARGGIQVKTYGGLACIRAVRLD